MVNRQPKLILRESCINDIAKLCAPGRFLEIGAGTGYMTKVFLLQAYQGACYEPGEKSRSLLSKNLAAFGNQIHVANDLNELVPDSFDYLFAFEVLEHIPEDHSALAAWTQHLKPGGKILLSVPAHAKKFGKSDEIVGHVRRYEKDQLYELLTGAGFQNIHIVNYGFPITEATRSLSNWLVRRESSHLSLSAEERSMISSFTRPPFISSIISYIGESIFTPFCSLQRLFYTFDWGEDMLSWRKNRLPPKEQPKVWC